MGKNIKSLILNLDEILENKFQNKWVFAMITNHKRFSRKKTVVAFALLISIGFISFSLSCVSGVKQVQTGERVNALNEVSTSPSVIHTVPPSYPFEAAQKGIEGKVTVQFVVTKEGAVKDPIILESSPVDVFDQAALETVTQYTFKPGTKGGKAVDLIVRLPIVFQLSAKGESENGEINDDYKIVCRYEAKIGSLFKNKICATKAEWAAAREEAQELIREIMYRSSKNDYYSPYSSPSQR